MTLQLVTDEPPSEAEREYRRKMFWTCNDPEEAYWALQQRDERIVKLEELNAKLAARIDELEAEKKQ